MHYNTQAMYAPSPGQTAFSAPASSGVTCSLAKLRAVDVRVADIHDGIAITFSGSPSEVYQLREDVRALAEANDKYENAFAACPCEVRDHSVGVTEKMANSGTDETLGGPTDGDWRRAEDTNRRRARELPRAEATTRDTTTGAVLDLKATHPSQVEPLREAIRARVGELEENCLNNGGRPAEAPGS
jgi:hypothetical protein